MREYYLSRRRTQPTPRRSQIEGRGNGPAFRIWQTPAGKMRFALDLVQLKKQLEEGTLSDFDRQGAETLQPGCCDFVTGKTKSMRGGGGLARAGEFLLPLPGARDADS